MSSDEKKNFDKHVHYFGALPCHEDFPFYIKNAN